MIESFDEVLAAASQSGGHNRHSSFGNNNNTGNLYSGANTSMGVSFPSKVIMKPSHIKNNSMNVMMINDNEMYINNKRSKM